MGGEGLGGGVGGEGGVEGGFEGIDARRYMMTSNESVSG